MVICMHGSVREWCEDVYQNGFYSKPEAGGPNPVSISCSEDRIQRGGGWSQDAARCRSAYRLWNDAGVRESGLGFRPSGNVEALSFKSTALNSLSQLKEDRVKSLLSIPKERWMEALSALGVSEVTSLVSDP